ncbi:phospholipase [Burkholderia sp. A9]|uniref:Phospholipase/Carboxylesterase n=1 Tax=Burkholderia cepacia GG4 TaxID=1009846 RepID=A0A9W3K5Z7_BURCE|nr:MULTISPECIES: phospholipase [Burkholderia]AFQ51353.1 Phospholipase/Carboxylesterase [Burkholderia cepacia GG4]KHK60359.1 phospholipase [Burkholderia sp. A9]
MTNAHLEQPVADYGESVDRAATAVILVHGRGQSPGWMHDHVVRRFGRPDLAWRAPMADGASWYPERFLAPVELNEPRLSDALACLEALSERLRLQGIPYASQVLMGFSQGACLCSEFVWRSRRRYRALVSFTGALIGPPDLQRAPDARDFSGMPVLFSTWEHDPHVPAEDVRRSAAWFDAAGAAVVLHVDPATEHGIRDAEIEYARRALGT